MRSADEAPGMVLWFQTKVRSRTSRRQVCIHRSMIAFILRTSVRTTSGPGCSHMTAIVEYTLWVPELGRWP